MRQSTRATTGRERSRRPCLRAIVVAALLALVAPLAACADDDPDASPRPGTETFGEGQFSDIPLVEGSQQIGPTSTDGDGVVAGTWTVPGHTAPSIVEEMTSQLRSAGWTVLVEPVERPEGAFRAEFGDDQRRLEVIATGVDGIEGIGSRVDAQYSLLLHPDLDDADVDAGRESTGG